MVVLIKASGGGKAKENVIDLQRLMNQKVMIKFNGGREVVGVLKGFDPTLNVVIDDTVSFLGFFPFLTFLFLFIYR